MIIRRSKTYIALVLLLAAFFGMPLDSVAQQMDTSEVHFIADKEVYDLIDKHIQFNKSIGKTPGYRILIFSDSGVNSKQKAFSMRAGFINRFGSTKSYVFFEEPNYKIRVGNFRTSIEAESYLQKILRVYPGAFVVKDMIEFPVLRNMKEN